MAEKIINSRIVHKHDVEANWIQISSFIPKQGELIIYDIDETYNYNRFKIGDGVTTVGSLPFVNDDVKALISTLVGDIPVSEQISTSIKDVLYKTQQELTAEEIEQVRQNIHSAGVMTTGLTMTPFNVTEVNDYDDWEVEYLDPIVAAQGAEIYGDYEYNVATGMWSRASGAGTQALGDFSDASGWLTKATAFCSIASGRQTVSSGPYSHAEGHNTQALKNDSHAEGEGSIANGARAHAEGYFTQANSNQAHSEGMNTIASGVNSHAEGWATTASGQNAFSGGKNTKASGTNSFANGLGTIAAGAQQVVHGKYNVSDTTSLMIVGNGTSDTARANVYTLDKSGNGWFAGGITVGANNASVITEEDYIIFDGGTSEDVI